MEFFLMLRPWISVLIPLTASALILLYGGRIKENLREGITLGAAILMVVCVFSMLPEVLSGNSFTVSLFRIADGITFALKADAVGMVFACVASGLWIITSVYSIGYMRGHNEKNQTGYFAAFAMCLCGAMGICFAANLLTFFVFYEILTVATYPLVVHYRDDKGKRAGRKYLIYTLVSGQLFFAGLLILYTECGTLDFVPGGFVDGNLSGGTTIFAFVLLICAGAVKAGVMPLHSWLPAAMVAPTPVSALLHAVAVVKAGAFCVIRIICYTFGPEVCQKYELNTTLAWIAVITILTGSLLAMQKDNLKARLAYSTVSQLSYIVLGICILSPISVTGAVYHIVAHAFMKITLFMCAGAIFVTAHKAEVSQMRGLAMRMPLTVIAFTLASLGIAGLPFFAGFVSKMNIMRGAAEMGQPFFVLTLAASALLSLTYLIPVGYVAFAGKNVNPEFLAYKGKKLSGEASALMLVPLMVTLVISVILGLMPDAGPELFTLAGQAAAEIFGGGV
ncbi:MAG: monovalent cation/H+ antiporter subunit D family protein [Emergencia sp.]|nr:monovalent cation/H+ antiporter subunit D family protein [Emergencia sp.]